MNPKPGSCVQGRACAALTEETNLNRWPRVMLISAVTSAWLIYDMATATEVPRQAVAMLQYGLLACALIGLLGSLVMAASQK
jgi:hypothetical protein